MAASLDNTPGADVVEAAQEARTPEIPKQTDRRAGAGDNGGTHQETQANAQHEAEDALRAEHRDAAQAGNLEGRREVQVVDPADPGHTITDIDEVKDGVLWEEKSATSAGDVDKWVDKQVTGKLEKYLEAREHLPGYEDAPIGLRMTEPGVDPPLRNAIENAIDQFRREHPGVDVRLEFTG